jgi:hypothetical protein
VPPLVTHLRLRWLDVTTAPLKRLTMSMCETGGERVLNSDPPAVAVWGEADGNHVTAGFDEGTPGSGIQSELAHKVGGKAFADTGGVNGCTPRHRDGLAIDSYSLKVSRHCGARREGG